ncbi:MAG: aminotransferase [Comamonadaceae bacterium CG_4_10_14_3_um_filter_60_42]|nr:MAG: aminotransferase [Comamonadaceae bacterium CG_4_10_14_3_um_filter_60_42]
MSADRTHGGCDALGAPQHDFSTNSNACSPCPVALAAVQAAAVTQYPDPAYTALSERLAALHGVASERVLLAASASEFIFRISAWARQHGVRRVQLPAHHYGDYARAALAWGLQPVISRAGVAPVEADSDALHWTCEPSSPLGQAHVGWPAWLTQPASDAGDATELIKATGLVVLDAAYAPLRLSGKPSLREAQLDQVWQLFTPNKALGLTGVRAAYVIAPSIEKTRARGQIDAIKSLNLLAPSWLLGAHGVALLQAWVTPAVQAWLLACLPTLRDWKARQIDMLQNLGWTCLPSEANFFCARPPQPLDLAALRNAHGIKLRDCASFGLPGWLRLGVLGPQAQAALAQALAHLGQPNSVSI